MSKYEDLRRDLDEQLSTLQPVSDQEEARRLCAAAKRWEDEQPSFKVLRHYDVKAGYFVAAVY